MIELAALFLECSAQGSSSNVLLTANIRTTALGISTFQHMLPHIIFRLEAVCANTARTQE